jgi:phosphoserine phosphatase
VLEINHARHLIIDDSDHLWGEFLAEEGVVDVDHYRKQNDRFLHQYQEGTLDIHEFLRFSLQVLARVEPAEL